MPVQMRYWQPVPDPAIEPIKTIPTYEGHQVIVSRHENGFFGLAVDLHCPIDDEVCRHEGGGRWNCPCGTWYIGHARGDDKIEFNPKR